MAAELEELAEALRAEFAFLERQGSVFEQRLEQQLAVESVSRPLGPNELEQKVSSIRGKISATKAALLRKSAQFFVERERKSREQAQAVSHAQPQEGSRDVVRERYKISRSKARFLEQWLSYAPLSLLLLT